MYWYGKWNLCTDFKVSVTTKSRTPTINKLKVAPVTYIRGGNMTLWVRTRSVHRENDQLASVLEIIMVANRPAPHLKLPGWGGKHSVHHNLVRGGNWNWLTEPMVALLHLREAVMFLLFLKPHNIGMGYHPERCKSGNSQEESIHVTSGTCQR